MKEGTANVLIQCGFEDEVNLVKQGKCPLCKVKVIKEELRDDISKEEFELSGMCQDCQDEAFLDNHVTGNEQFRVERRKP